MAYPGNRTTSCTHTSETLSNTEPVHALIVCSTLEEGEIDGEATVSTADSTQVTGKGFS